MESNWEIMKTFLEPQSLAIVGVSTRTGGKESLNILENLRHHGYKRKVFSVNPKGGTVLGEKLYPSVSAIPEPIDLAIINVQREGVLEVIEECLAKGVKGIVIITQGFADATDEEGKRLQKEIVARAREKGVRVLGPNTLGVVNNFDSFLPSFVYLESKISPIGLIVQSGIFFVGDHMHGGIGLGIDLGNAADLGFPEALAYLGADPRIKIINIHMEDVKRGKEFLGEAKKVSCQKPVLVLKTARSSQGVRAASSHTGSLAGEDRVYEAAFREAGVIRVETTEELYDLNQIFLNNPYPKGNRVGMITTTGGGGIIAIDACSKYGLEFPLLSPKTEAKLKKYFPPWADIGNPLDMWIAGAFHGFKEVYAACLEAFLAEPNFDALLCAAPCFTPLEEGRLFNVIPLLIEKAKGKKPLAVWPYASYQKEGLQKLAAEGVAAYPTLERAGRALGALWQYQEIKAKPREENYFSFSDVGHAKAKAILDQACREGKRELGIEGFALLKAYGLPVPSVKLASSCEEALGYAAEMGYPVVLKVVSPEISHKSDVGGVKINLKDSAELQQGYAEIMASVKERAPQAQVTGVLLQPYLAGGKELILGAKQDPQFGPVLVFGAGGVFTEIIAEVSFRLAPLSQEAAAEMIRETKIYPLLRGARGEKPSDLEALEASILRLSQLVCDFPEIAEMDLNPFVVFEKGAVALDVRLRLRD